MCSIFFPIDIFMRRGLINVVLLVCIVLLLVACYLSVQGG